MKYKAYLYHIYCKVKNRIQREKQVIQSDQDVHFYELGWMRWKLLLYVLSMYKLFSEQGYLCQTRGSGTAKIALF